MFSKACEYGIRSVVFIASESINGKRANLTEIAAATDSPIAFTAKILQVIAKNNLVDSFKGPNGGFFIDTNQRERITLHDIVDAIDGKDIYKRCGLGLKECSEEHHCPVHNEFKAIRTDLQNMLKNTSIQKLATELHDGLSFLKV